VAPSVAWLFIEAVQAAGLPPGLINVLWGSSELGEALVDHPGVDQISFTGSTAIGRRIMAAAAARVARVTLELGGKSAAVLLDDADLDAALPMVLRAGVVNSGQACVSQSRLLVPRQRLPEIEQRLVELAKGWHPGHPMDEATRLGPVATGVQFERINRMIEAARAGGARVLCGGPGRPAGMERGWFLAPTLLHVTDPQLPISCEEVFGPVIAVLGYDDQDEAARLANATPYGLSGAVWSADPQRALAFGRRMRTGQVVINGAAQNLATPFGGWGQSGFGRENGRFGIEECLQYRALHGAVPT
jgi:aldehyde dehydrogenase (NAD+)